MRRDLGATIGSKTPFSLHHVARGRAAASTLHSCWAPLRLLALLHQHRQYLVLGRLDGCSGDFVVGIDGHEQSVRYGRRDGPLGLACTLGCQFDGPEDESIACLASDGDLEEVVRVKVRGIDHVESLSDAQPARKTCRPHRQDGPTATPDRGRRSHRCPREAAIGTWTVLGSVGPISLEIADANVAVDSKLEPAAMRFV